MQTFLPYENFELSANALDWKRCGKQIVEASQIMAAHQDSTVGWQNHPATRMWRGHNVALLNYATAMHNSWVSRGYNIHKSYINLMKTFLKMDVQSGNPEWLGDERFHASHRSNLLRKKPEHYSQFGWTETDDMPYYWPV